MDQALGIYHRSILPQIEKRRGYASSLVFSCKEKNELISCALLETHDSMVEVDRSGFLQRFASGGVWLRTLATPMAPVWATKKLVLRHYITLRWIAGDPV